MRLFSQRRDIRIPGPRTSHHALQSENYMCGGHVVIRGHRLRDLQGRGAPELLQADSHQIADVNRSLSYIKQLFSAEPNSVRNEVWCWDIPEIVRKNIDDVLAQDLVIEVGVAFPWLSVLVLMRDLITRFLVARGGTTRPFKGEKNGAAPVL
jgi:hypothetical protein